MVIDRGQDGLLPFVQKNICFKKTVVQTDIYSKKHLFKSTKYNMPSFIGISGNESINKFALTKHFFTLSLSIISQP